MLLSTHPPHVAPPLPHLVADWLATGTQTPASSQPVQHVPPMHVPPGQLTPSPTATLEQAPPAQLSLVQGLLSLQLLHAPPPLPHCVTLVPVEHVPPLQHCAEPKQQLPPQHAPPLRPHKSPSGAGVPVQAPLRPQTAFRRHALVVQSVHDDAAPHVVAVAPTQELPLQHCPAPQHAPLQQSVPAAQQVMLLQQTPVPHPPGVQMACDTAPSSSSGDGSSTEQTVSATVAVMSQRAARQARIHLRSVESIIESLPR
jgi:hypothetical protein